MFRSDQSRPLASPRPRVAQRPLPGNRPTSSVLKSRFELLRQGNPGAISLLLFVLVACVFLPSLRNGFVNFDDDFYVYANAHVQQGLTWESIRWAFTNFVGGFWHPLTWLSIMLDCQLFGLRPAGHHLTSLLLHAANAALLFLVLQRLTSAPWRSAFIAALFALHPLHVESVAWAAERKDVLSTFFWMLTLLMYAHYVQAGKKVGAQAADGSQALRVHLPSPIFYLLSFLFFLCGLLSKSMLVTLPFVLLLLDWWPLRRFQPTALNPRVAALFVEKLPFFAAALLASLISIHAEKVIGALQTATESRLSHRIGNAPFSYVVYLAQMVWPRKLAAYYPFLATLPLWPVIGAALLLFTISVLVLRAVRTRPYLAFGWIWYVVTLLPVIGLIQLGGQSHADRYTYVPLIGIFTLVAWSACDLTKRWHYQAVVLSAAAAGIFLLCLAGTTVQIGYWKDSETLFRHALLVTENNDLAHNNLGVALAARGRFEEAGRHFREAVRINPPHAQAHINLGKALNLEGRTNEALAQYRAAVESKPDYAEAQYFLAAALARQGKMPEAVAHFRDALRGHPDYAPALNDLAWILATERNPGIRNVPEAIQLGMRACELSAHTNAVYLDTLGTAFSEAGRWAEAIEATEKAAALAAAAGRAGLASQIQSHLQLYQTQPAHQLLPPEKTR